MPDSFFLNYLLKGIVIGLIFGVPAGAVGAMTVQRTIEYGPRTGVLTGIGSSVADCLYACVGAFGLTFISEFLLNHQKAINTVGGGFLLLLGLRLLGKKNSVRKESKKAGISGTFLSSFVVGITNPAAILTFLFAFSYFGISGEMGFSHGSLLVLGVFLGTFCWWITLAALTEKLKGRFAEHIVVPMNRVFGIILSLSGVAVLAGLMQKGT